MKRIELMHSKKYIFAGLLILALILAACGTASPTQESSPAGASDTPAIATASETSVEVAPTATEPEPTQAPSLTPEPTQAPSLMPTSGEKYLGDIVEQGGFWLTALAVQDPATPGMFASIGEGNKLVAVEVVIGNTTDTPLSVNTFYAELVDTDGFTYQSSMALDSDIELDTVTLFKGEKAKGWIGFEIPLDAIPALVIYNPEFSSEVSLEASLLPAPAAHVADTTLLAATPESPEVRLGETATAGGAALTVLTVEDPSAPGLLTSDIPGTRFVSVQVVFENQSAAELSVNSLYCYLVDDQGYVYAAEPFGRDDGLEATDLAQGRKVQGWVTFRIPEESKPAAFKYELNGFSGEFLAVSLLP
jgi:hypothetical protein